jgi:hypothetical protein
MFLKLSFLLSLFSLLGSNFVKIIFVIIFKIMNINLINYIQITINNNSLIISKLKKLYFLKRIYLTYTFLIVNSFK